MRTKPSAGDLARAYALLADSTTAAAPEQSGHRLFAQMDRAVHRRPGWAASISMSSARSTYYETGNGENTRGWHTGSGMTYWWGQDYGNDQYSDGFWSTVDPYRLPGTTVSRKPLADEEGGLWGASRPAMLWAGGATDGHYAAVGQDVRGLSSYLEGKKSWFCLDEMIACLGAGIYSSDGFTVETTVDNRNLGSTGTHALVVDGSVCDAEPGKARVYRDAGYATIEGFGSYVFPGGTDVHVLSKSRTADGLTRRLLALWIDHGVDPRSSQYAYYLVPRADQSTAADLAARTPIAILANTPAIQAIHDPGSGLTAANFFGEGTVSTISADTPCSVLLRDVDGTPHLTVAEPTRAAETVTVSVSPCGSPHPSPSPCTSVTPTGPATHRL
ncbi:polysaccharide lyase family 8 super-sandwich domain-containing protein [Streptomyces sp. NPDC058232]|uniref:polysaccharide lyase family 8 super-sandwich domain-containing protein n=1 Tax=Streptomyces sp. NPDC058232 TaxID=3346393 RepID=UPI0036E0D3BB